MKKRRVIGKPRVRRKLRQCHLEVLETRRLMFAASVFEGITQDALGFLRPEIQQQISAANASQSGCQPAGLDFYPRRDAFQGSDFSGSADRINERYDGLLSAADPEAPDWGQTAQCFGRILHAAQSFYANSNWIDLQDLNHVSAGTTLAEGSLDYWDNFTPYSQVGGVMVVQGEDQSPRTPFGVGSLTASSLQPPGQSYEAQVLEVTVPTPGAPAESTTTFRGLTSGVTLLPDDAPNNVAVAESAVYKGNENHPRFGRAVELAVEQTQHEVARLINLLTERYGNADHLIEQWVDPVQLSTFNAFLDSKSAAASLGTLKQALAGGGIANVTVITHGFQLGNQDGDSLLDLAQALHHRTGGWFVDYDVPKQGGQGRFQVRQLPDKLADGHLVLLFDWAAESNEDSAGWTGAASEALFAMLADLGIVDPTLDPGNARSLHFIAHSFGSAVTSGVVERLGAYDIPVTQVTYLDPHDFSQGLLFDTAQQQYLTGLPQPGADSGDAIFNYGVTNWDNVGFTDVYFQTRNAGAVDAIVPGGRPIPGAYNRWLSTGDGLPPAGSYGLYAGGDHSYAWDYWYTSSIIGTEATDNLDRPVTVAQSGQTTSQYLAGQGYALSKIASGQKPKLATLGPQYAGNFYSLPAPAGTGDEQPHRFSSPLIVNPQTGSPQPVLPTGLTVSQLQAGAWPARLTPPIALANGDFEYRGDTANLVFDDNLFPGWSHHGGGGNGTIDDAAGNHFLRLDAGGARRTHNEFYLDQQAAVLAF